MPSKRKERNAVLLDPSETVAYRLQDGATTINLSIFRDENGDHELIQCDLCGDFITLTVSRHLQYFINHRGKDQCNKQVRRRNEAAEREAETSALRDAFLHAVPQHSGEQTGVLYSLFIIYSADTLSNLTASQHSTRVSRCFSIANSSPNSTLLVSS